MYRVFLSISYLFHPSLAFFIIKSISLFFSFLEQIQRWLRQVNKSLFYQFFHVPENKSKDKCSNVASVHIRIRHDDKFVVAKFGKIERFWIFRCSYLNTQCGEHISDLFVVINLVLHRFFHVQYFTTKWKNCLVAPVSSLLCCSTCRISLNQKQFATERIFVTAIG